jgi:hypothetical protein
LVPKLDDPIYKGIFSDICPAISDSDYVASNDFITMNNKMERM